MAALAFGICYAIRELYLVTNAFIRCGCDLHKSLNYIRAKNRLRLFQKYCEAVWLQYEYESLVDYAAVADNNSNNIRCDSKNVQRLVRFKTKMHRRRIAGAEIDFAAIEASALAREASEGYLMKPVDEADGDSERRNLSLEQELEFETLENPEDIEIVSGVEADVSYYDHIDSHPQCREINLGELKEGVCFVVTGRILLTCERFSINFLIENPSRDVALHINPRLPQNYVVRNTRVRNVWGREEIATNLPFNLNRGTEFVIHVLFTETCFMISTNGYHIANYKHRLPYRTIKAIEVKGDVERVRIQREVISAYPVRKQQIQKISESLLSSKFVINADGTIAKEAFYQKMRSEVIRVDLSPSVTENLQTLPMPYIGILEQGRFDVGCAISFEGRIKLLPHSFYINLQDNVNIWPHPIIAFHFNPRFSSRGGAVLGKAIVCRNAWYNGQWAKEQRSELDTNLMPGKRFNLIILARQDEFEVFVNSKLVTSFKHQIPPATVSTVYVRGDVHLTDVTVLVPTLSAQKTIQKFVTKVKDSHTRKTMHITNNPSYAETEDPESPSSDGKENVFTKSPTNDRNENIYPENSGDERDQNINFDEPSNDRVEDKIAENPRNDRMETTKAENPNNDLKETKKAENPSIDRKETTKAENLSNDRTEAPNAENLSNDRTEAANAQNPSSDTFVTALEEQFSEDAVTDEKVKAKSPENGDRPSPK